MLAENCNYMKSYMVVKNMVKAGLFGKVFYAEGEYLHDCRHLWDKTPWRREMQKIGGITYGTHSLGPVLSWFEGDRVSRVCCIGSGYNNLDLHGKPIEREDSYVMLCKTEQERLIKIRTDGVSPRPYGRNHLLQGTKGVYESQRIGEGDGRKGIEKVYIEGQSEEECWDELSKFEKKYTPKLWTDYESNNKTGGANNLMLLDFINSIYNNKKSPIDIHAAMDMTLPGIISQQSVLRNNIWLEVPDSRSW
jgi:predicted dehydrogenase